MRGTPNTNQGLRSRTQNAKTSSSLKFISLRAIMTGSHRSSPQLMQLQFKLQSILRDWDLKITIRENLFNILLKTLTSWAQRDKTLQETVTFTDKKKIAYNYSDPGGTLEKLNNLKPLFSRIEELNISKEVKENALASEGKSYADQTQ